MILEIKPQTKLRPRFSGHAYTDPKTKKYEEAIGTLYLAGKGKMHTGKLKVYIRFCFAVKDKKKQFAFKDTKPDIDNLIKSLLDGLNGVAWKDDAQIVEIKAAKLYHDYDFILLDITEVD